MTEHLLVLVLTTLANLILGTAVWLKDRRREVNQCFGLFSASIAIWALSNGLVNTYAGTPSGTTWARITFASASASAVSFLAFVRVFPSIDVNSSFTLHRMFRYAGFAAIALSFTPLITQRTASESGVLHVTYGPLHPLFGAFFLSCSTYSLVVLIRKLGALKGIKRLQVTYVFVGVLLAALGGTITNLLIPLAWGSSKFSAYGPIFTLVMVAAIAHSIIRHRLLNIRLVLTRGFTYLISVAMVVSLFVFLVWISSGILSADPRALPLSVHIGLVSLVVLIFHPLKRWLQVSMDSYFFRETYDYQRTIREVSRTMGTLLDLQSLLKYACDAMDRTVKPESIAVYAEDVNTACYRRLVARRSIELHENTGPELLEASSPIVRHLAAARTRLLADELARAKADASLAALIEDVRRLEVELALPIVEDGRLTGFFLLGPKLSADPYFSDDIDLLDTLVSQAAIAIKNAQLYRHVVLVNEYIENILSTMDSGVIAVRADETITLFNPAAERITGLRASDVRQGRLDQLPASISALLQATLSDRQPRPQVETAISARGRGPIPLICSTSTLLDGSGNVLGAVAVLGDLTRLKQLESEKRRAERLASVGALATGIGHEIKNPLVAIKTFAELLPERFAEEDFRSDFSKVVTREIERIDGLVDRLRGLATPARRPLTPIDVRYPIDETLALLRGQIEQGKITVRTVIDPDLPLVVADPAQLKQLFLNVLQNGLEAMKPDGELTIRLSTHDSYGAEVLSVEMKDTGSGIPDNLIGRIFDPFVTSKKHGSGLGLSICRGIADHHGAMIRAGNNADGRGATITIEFPVARNAASTLSGQRS